MHLGNLIYAGLGYKPPDEGPQEYQSIPLHKIEDFGVHCKNYYPLNISYFKSSLDSSILNFMWTTYWKNTLTSNPLVTNSQYLTSQVSDLAAKLEQVIVQLFIGFICKIFSWEVRTVRCFPTAFQKLSKTARSWVAKWFRV